MFDRLFAPIAGLAWLMVLSASPLAHAEEAGAAEPPRVYPCYQARGGIEIDGLLDESAWEEAAVLQPFWKLDSGEEAVRGGSARLLWDADFLYLAGDLVDRDLYAVLKDHDARTWNDDVLELFLKPRDDSYQYYELHVTPGNTTLDLMFPRRGAGQWDRFVSFESGLVSAVELRGTVNNWRDQDEGWSIEMKVPFAAIDVIGGRAPVTGDQWRFAVCRYNYSVHLPEDFAQGLEYSTTVRNLSGGFHTYEDYDLLHFLEVK